MKRAFPQKIKPVAYQLTDCDIAGDSAKQSATGVNRRARTSAAMIGLALSMGASSLLLPRQDDGAIAAEPQAVESKTAAGIPLPGQVAPQQSDAEPEVSETRSASSSGITHVVREGETLWSLSREYRISVQQLAEANGFSNGSVLRVGQRIQVPVAARFTNSRTASLPQTADESTDSISALRLQRDNSLVRLREQRDKLRTSLSTTPASAQRPFSLTESPSPKLDSTAVATPDAMPSPVPALPKIRVESTPQSRVLDASGQGSVTHRVQPGDTLDTIAVRYGVSRLELAYVNRLQDMDSLQVDQLLTIPSTLAPTSTIESGDGISTTVYRVVPGDTVAEIARIHNVSRSDLIRENNLSDPNYILVGQVLQIPSSSLSVDGSIGRSPLASPQTTLPVEAVTVPTAQFAPEGVADLSTTLAQVPEVTGIPTIPVPPVVEQPTIVASTADVSFTAEFSETAAPQEVAVAPLSQPTVEPAVGNRSQTRGTVSTNPYVDNLLSEIHTMRDRLRNQEAPRIAEVEQPAVVASASNGSATSAIVAPDRVNPQFSPERFDQLEASQSSDRVELQARAIQPDGSESVPAPQSPDIVAAAPLGSENYAPLLQPITGQMVSPDLPALSDESAYLPEGSGLFNGYIWPARGVLTSGYGWRWGRMHRGIDIGAPVGTAVYAAADGVIEFSGWNSGGYGNMVEIRHSDGSMTRYAHHSRNLVRVGQQVTQGQQIAEVGSTGYSTGPHLHFEVHLPNQGTVNPIAYLPR